MSLKNVDIESALRRVADRRIEEAMKAGKFDNLPGKGKPLDLEPMPAEENARMTWWMLRILRKNDFTPDEVRLRKEIEQAKEQLSTIGEERHLPPLVNRINQLVRQLNTLGTNAIGTNTIDLAVTPVNLEVARQEWRSRTARTRAGR